MRKCILYGFLLLFLSGCDSGDIYDREISVEKTGKTVKLTAVVSGIGDDEVDYNVALAAFSDDSKYAITQKVISENSENEQPISLVLDNLSNRINTVELVLTNTLRKRILTLVSINIEDFVTKGDTIYMDLGTIRLDRVGCIQQGVFNVACVQCHGANGRSAAGLDLTVALPPKDKLNQILIDGGVNILHYNHTDVLSSHFKNNLDEVKSLLYGWIENEE